MSPVNTELWLSPDIGEISRKRIRTITCETEGYDVKSIGRSVGPCKNSTSFPAYINIKFEPQRRLFAIQIISNLHIGNLIFKEFFFFIIYNLNQQSEFTFYKLML
jgi:hypothetical protein